LWHLALTGSLLDGLRPTLLAQARLTIERTWRSRKRERQGKKAHVLPVLVNFDRAAHRFHFRLLYVISETSIESNSTAMEKPAVGCK
jgi:hypothetical protein